MTKIYLWITGSSMALLLIAISLLAPLLLSKKSIAGITDTFQISIEKIGLSEVGVLTLFSTGDILLLIASITLVRLFISLPIGVYAGEKKGLPHLLVKGIYNFHSTVPVLLVAALFMNLPFLLFTDDRFLWSVIVLALIGVGPVSLAIQHDSHKLTLRKEAVRAKKDGEKWGPRFIFWYIIPFIFPTLLLQFLLDLGRVTVLLTQLALLSIFINVVYTPLKFGFGELAVNKLDWIVLLGHTKELVSQSPFLPLIPLFAFLYTYLTFITLAEAFRRTIYKKQERTIANSILGKTELSL